ncbi:hypothetical protein BC835DRAFT_1399674 [Cytidiella melzeri]|nr:hypothetical protein BC835DRAFT_1399674 [Cytidiella melzeri]
MANDTLFLDVFYYLSKALPPKQRSQLSQVLDLNGAKPVEISDEKLTHYVTNLPPGPNSLESLPEQSNAQLVTPFWVERTLVLGIQQDALSYSPDPSMLFSGVVATSCDLSASDNEVLSAGISSLGGQWRSALTKDVTHLFALSTGSQKYETAMHFKEGTGMKVLVPHWFDDVVRLGVRSLSTEEYEWPKPKLFQAFGTTALGSTPGEGARAEKRAKPLTTERNAFYDTALGEAKDLPVRTSEGGDVWKDRKVVLGSSLGLNDSQRQAHTADIVREGGMVLDFESLEDELAKIEEADIYITRYRSGPTFVKAYRLNKTIGTLPWLWFVRATGSLTCPIDQLLHYPVPKSHIANFSRHIITVTNYTGKDREYIKKLIIAMGAEFTPSMSGKNTVVVAAYMSGTKTSKATSWGIPIVNHLWLEDCFSQWRDVSPANEKYVVFPPGVDYGSVLTEERGLAVGRVGYDQAELDAMEREIETEESIAGGLVPHSQPRKGILKKTSSLADNISMASVRSIEEVENAVAPGRSTEGRDEDVFMSGVDRVVETDAGAYQDLDVPLDEDGRLSLSGDSDFESAHKMEVVSGSRPVPGTPARAGRTKTPAKLAQSRATSAKKPFTPTSVKSLQANSKSRAMLSSESDDEEVSPIRPMKKLVRRVGRPPSSHRSPTKENLKKAAANSSDGDHVHLSAKKGSVIKTYRTRSRSRSRGRLETEASSNEDLSTRTGQKLSHPAAKGQRKSVAARDREDLDTGVEKPVASKLRTPTKVAAATRRRPTIPSDNEASEHERGRSSKRIVQNGSRVSLPAQDGVSARAVRTPGREMSVLLPTLKQVRSASSQRIVKEPKVSEADKSIARVESIVLQAQDASAHMSRKRSRPGKNPVEEPSTPAKPAVSAQPPLPRAKTVRQLKNITPEPGPSRVPEVPVSLTRTPSKRSAATKATQKLHDQVMPDVISFQKELKNGNVRSALDVEQASTRKAQADAKKTGKKRASLGDGEEERGGSEGPETKRQKTMTGMKKAGRKSDVAQEDTSEDEEDSSRPTKSRKKPEREVEATRKASSSSVQPESVVVMTTQVTLSDDQIKAFTKLGGKFTTKPSECTHLVAASIVRTEKFLCAMAVASHVVTRKWVEMCVAKKTILPTDTFMLRNPENEKKYGFKLADALKRARANKGKLLEGKTFYMTKNVPVEAKLMKNVVTAGGGQFSTQVPTVRIMKGSSNRVVISSPDDIAIWRPLAEHGFPIYSQELILTGMLKQELDWDSPSHRVAGSV